MQMTKQIEHLSNEIVKKGLPQFALELKEKLKQISVWSYFEEYDGGIKLQAAENTLYIGSNIIVVWDAYRQSWRTKCHSNIVIPKNKNFDEKEYISKLLTLINNLVEVYNWELLNYKEVRSAMNLKLLFIRLNEEIQQLTPVFLAHNTNKLFLPELNFEITNYFTNSSNSEPIIYDIGYQGNINITTYTQCQLTDEEMYTYVLREGLIEHVKSKTLSSIFKSPAKDGVNDIVETTILERFFAIGMRGDGSNLYAAISLKKQIDFYETRLALYNAVKKTKEMQTNGIKIVVTYFQSDIGFLSAIPQTERVIFTQSEEELYNEFVNAFFKKE